PLGRIGGVPVFFRSSGFGFKLVLEGRAGNSGVAVGSTTFDPQPGDPSHRPHAQIESDVPLRDRRPAGCEGRGPAIVPPDFGPAQAVADALNDLGCNANATTSKDLACTLDQFGAPSFLGAGTQLQFCLQVSRTLVFASGDTVLTARLRDLVGDLG